MDTFLIILAGLIVWILVGLLTARFMGLTEHTE